MKYRHKPITVEAFRMTPERRADNRDWPEWLHEAWNRDRHAPGSVYPAEVSAAHGTLSIGTLGGEYKVSWEDFIVRGIKGELYPCKPEIFELSYDAVPDGAEPEPASIEMITGATFLPPSPLFDVEVERKKADGSSVKARVSGDNLERVRIAALRSVRSEILNVEQGESE